MNRQSAPAQGHPMGRSMKIGFSSLGGRKPELTTLLFTADAGDFEKKRPVAISNDDLKQPPKGEKENPYQSRMYLSGRASDLVRRKQRIRGQTEKE